MIQKTIQFLVGIVLTLPLMYEARADTVTYYHNDLLGSPVAATNEAGQVIWREGYRPYGERLANDPLAQRNDVWYTSKPQDADTGLVYLGARYYDPVIGRFISMDPVGFDGKNIHSFNRYAYANNNPYKFVDPSGHSPLNLIAWEIAKSTGIGYSLGVAADAISQGMAFGSVDFAMAATSSAAQAGGEVGLLGGLFSGAAAARSAVQAGRSASAGEKFAVDANKLNHIFGESGHNLGPIVERFGSQEAAFSAIRAATEATVNSRGLTGVFKTVVEVEGVQITVGGKVVDGIAKIGTAYIP